METTRPKSKSKAKINKTNRIEDNRIKDKVKEQVIALLGKPDDLWRLDIHLYQGERARVNIWQRGMIRAEEQGGFMGAMGKPELVEITHITDSFYLRLSKTGIIESANPPILRKY